jgi:hypothetical protein
MSRARAVSFDLLIGARVFPLLDQRALWVIFHFFRQHSPDITFLELFYKCQATRTYRQNIAPIAFFGGQN